MSVSVSHRASENTHTHRAKSVASRLFNLCARISVRKTFQRIFFIVIAMMNSSFRAFERNQFRKNTLTFLNDICSNFDLFKYIYIYVDASYFGYKVITYIYLSLPQFPIFSAKNRIFSKGERSIRETTVSLVRTQMYKGARAAKAPESINVEKSGHSPRCPSDSSEPWKSNPARDVAQKGHRAVA